MKNLAAYCTGVFGAFVLTAASASAQGTATTSASTGYLGYYTIDIPVGNSLWVPALVAADDFAGAITTNTPGGTTSTITTTGAGWTTGEFDVTTIAIPGPSTKDIPRYYLEIVESGSPVEGLVLDIISNTGDTLTVDADTSALTGTEQYVIRQHATLGGVFENGGGFEEDTDIIVFFQPDGSTVAFQWDGANWVIPGEFTFPRDAEVIYPGQGFLAFAPLSSKSVMIGGNVISTVKTTKTMTSVYGNNVVNLVGLMNPIVNQDPSLGDHDTGSPSNPANVSADEEAAIGDIGLRTSGFEDNTDNFVKFLNDGAITFTGAYQIDLDGDMFRLAPGPSGKANSDPVRNGHAFLIQLPFAADKAYIQPVLHPTP